MARLVASRRCRRGREFQTVVCGVAEHPYCPGGCGEALHVRRQLAELCLLGGEANSYHDRLTGVLERQPGREPQADPGYHYVAARRNQGSAHALAERTSARPHAGVLPG